MKSANIKYIKNLHLNAQSQNVRDGARQDTQRQHLEKNKINIIMNVTKKTIMKKFRNRICPTDARIRHILT